MTADAPADAAAFPAGKIALLGLLTIVAYGSWFYGFGVLIDDIADELPGGVFPLTVGYAIAQVGTGFLGIVAGRMLDRVGVRAPFAAGAVAGPGLLVLSASATDPWAFSVLFGLGGGVVGATAFYHLTQTVAVRLAAGFEVRAIARLTIWGAFASPILIPVTEVLRATVGWRATIRIAAVSVAVVLAWAAIRVDPDRRTASGFPSTSPLAAIRLALVEPRVRRFALSTMAGSMGASVLIVLQVPMMVAGGIERSTAAGLAAARGLAQLLGRLPIGWVLTRVSARAALRAAKWLITAGTVLLVLATSVPVAVLFVLVAGIGIGAVSPLDGIYAREVLPPQDLGVLMGGLHLLLGVAAGLGPVAAGIIVDASGDVWPGLLLATLASAVGAVLLRREPSTSPSTESAGH